MYSPLACALTLDERLRTDRRHVSEEGSATMTQTETTVSLAGMRELTISEQR